MPDLLDRLKQALADRYRVDREIGRGRMATVYLAQNLTRLQQGDLPRALALRSVHTWGRRIRGTGTVLAAVALSILPAGCDSGLGIDSTVVYVSVTNTLTRPIEITANGTVLGQVPEATFSSGVGATPSLIPATRLFSITRPQTLRLAWSLPQPMVGGVRVGEMVSEELFYDVASAGSDTVVQIIDNVIGPRTFFALGVLNHTGEMLLMGVNVGLPEENLCHCTVAPSAGDSGAFLGYYWWTPDANVRGYKAGSDYTGDYIEWTRSSGNLQFIDGSELVLAWATSPP